MKYLKGHRNKIYSILDTIDQMLSSGAYSDCEELLDSINVTLVKTELLVTYLVATLPASPHITNRSRFFDSVKAELYSRGEDVDSILIGLEGR